MGQNFIINLLRDSIEYVCVPEISRDKILDIYVIIKNIIIIKNLDKVILKEKLLYASFDRKSVRFKKVVQLQS